MRLPLSGRLFRSTFLFFATAGALGLPAGLAHAQGFGTGTNGLGLSVDGVCAVGTCPPSPTALNTDHTLPFSFVHTLANGDSYRIAGTMNSGSDNNGFSIHNNVLFTATYLGHVSPADQAADNSPSQQDTLTIAAYVNADETYANINIPNPVGVAFSSDIVASSSVSEVLVANGVTYPTVGPVSPPGPFTTVAPTRSVPGHQFNTVWTYTLTFGAGSPVGSWIQTGYFVLPTAGLVAAVLPTARTSSVIPATDKASDAADNAFSTVTAFATVINNSGNDNTNCSLSLPKEIPGQFHFQTTDPATNQPTGSADTAVTIPANKSQTFVFSVTPTSVFSQTIPIQFGCQYQFTKSVTGLNTFLLTASQTPIPDMLSIAATPSGDGVLNLAGPSGGNAFATSAINIGAAGPVTVSVSDAPPGQQPRGLPLALAICQTDLVVKPGGECVNPTSPGASVSLSPASNQTVTFSVFVGGAGNIAFDPERNRIYVTAVQNNTAVGQSSVAVRTQ